MFCLSAVQSNNVTYLLPSQIILSCVIYVWTRMASGSIFVVNRERVAKNSSLADQRIEERRKDGPEKLLTNQVS